MIVIYVICDIPSTLLPLTGIMCHIYAAILSNSSQQDNVPACITLTIIMFVLGLRLDYGGLRLIW